MHQCVCFVGDRCSSTRHTLAPPAVERSINFLKKYNNKDTLGLTHLSAACLSSVIHMLRSSRVCVCISYISGPTEQSPLIRNSPLSWLAISLTMSLRKGITDAFCSWKHNLFRTEFIFWFLKCTNTCPGTEIKHYIMYIFLYQCSKDKLLLFLLKESQNICEEQRMNICKREKETLGMELNTLMTKEIETHGSRTSQSARGGSTGQCWRVCES